jgi:choline dehydrogenase-like flavoprotein
VTRRYRDADTVDFVVVGSGASGGVLARELSRAGFDVVVMEQGPRLGMQDFEHDELKYWFANGITNDPAVSPQSYRKTPAAPAKTLRAGDFPAAWYARLVGGSSVHFTANYRRLHDVDFRERSLLGAIPGADLRDWPLGYDELEPYCTKVEWEVGVSGLAGTHPTEPRRSRSPRSRIAAARPACTTTTWRSASGSRRGARWSWPRTVRRRRACC